ncbi:Thioredoxin [Lacipirellula limnantheis]|uniref:Thioredoxin n=2 Tax=Lacipirellula limnantheis TaxID=2528024 RepID=A0A517U5X5_9BACT|nr:Thioredoxin [Lacipirellula limnantheis]
MSPEVTAASFPNLVEGGEPLAIHFWAEWDRVDRDMDKNIQLIAPRLKGWVSFYAADVDRPENIDWCKSLNVVSIPCLIVFVNGLRTRHIIGLGDEKELTQKILHGLCSAPTMQRPWWKFW